MSRMCSQIICDVLIFRKNYSPSTVTVSFRGASMLRTVTELYLGMNNLKSVPEGVADMSNLSLLDLKK